MADWRAVMTGGWFPSDGQRPNVYEVYTAGWWNAAGPAAPILVAAAIVQDLGLMVTMGIGIGR